MKSVDHVGWCWGTWHLSVGLVGVSFVTWDHLPLSQHWLELGDPNHGKSWTVKTLHVKQLGKTLRESCEGSSLGKKLENPQAERENSWTSWHKEINNMRSGCLRNPFNWFKQKGHGHRVPMNRGSRCEVTCDIWGLLAAMVGSSRSFIKMSIAQLLSIKGYCHNGFKKTRRYKLGCKPN